MRASLLSTAVLLSFVPLSPVAIADEIDLAVVHRIKQEAFERSQVMDTLFWLTDANGPRLTGSPGLRRAQEWSVRRMKVWGASNAGLESWGTFGRGWDFSRYSAHLLAPVYAPLPGVPMSWTRGTSGPESGDVVYAPLFPPEKPEGVWSYAKQSERIREYIKEHRGTLRGKIVLLSTPVDLTLPTTPAASRYGPDELAGQVEAPDPSPPVPYEWPLVELPAEAKKRNRIMESLPLEIRADLWELREQVMQPLLAFLADEGVTAVFQTGGRGSGGTIFAENFGYWKPGSPEPPPAISLAPETYDRMVRLLEKGVAVRAEIDLAAQYLDDDSQGYDVVGEIAGSSKRDEVVMLGGHLDSWHGGTGATDNATGCAVALEAFRILKTLKLPLARTVRLALWSGEEQALYGSRGYVARHFADPVTMKLQPEHAKLAAYFNLDNGSGKIRGVWLQGNDMVQPIFADWLAPFADLGATTLTLRGTGGTDHLSFDAVGLPGFQFIQDPLDYYARTHHSTLDVADHAQAGDLMQAAAIMASFVYDAANRPEKLPRKPLPPPLPPRTLSVPGAEN